MAKPAESRQFRGVYEKVAVGSAVADVASIANGAQATVAVTVPGVALDGTWVIDVVATSADPGAIEVSGRITAANTVTVMLQNNSGGAVDPASMTYRVVAMKIAQHMTL